MISNPFGMAKTAPGGGAVRHCGSRFLVEFECWLDEAADIFPALFRQSLAEWC